MKRVFKISFLLIILLTALSGRIQAENSEDLPPWSYNSKDYKYSGELNAVLIKGGEELKSGYLGAFVGDECRGYVEEQRFKPTGRRVFTLLIGSNVSSGETISFRYYDDEKERVYFVQETLPFESKMKVGSTWNPVKYHVLENSPPVVVNPLPDLNLDEHFGSVNIDLKDVFSDEDGDNLTLSALSSSTSVVTVSMNGNILTIQEAGLGTSTITVTARDDGKPVLSANETFTVTVNNVNDPPEVVQPVPDQLLQEGFGTKNIIISGTFRDPDGDVLQYTVTVDDPSVVTVSLSGSSLVISEAGNGKAVVMICASDGEYEVCCAFDLIVSEENRMELFVMDRPLFEGDTIGHCSDPDTVVLIVYSVVTWDVDSEDDWFKVTKANIYNAEIAFSGNTTGAARSGSLSVRDMQEHVVNLVVYQSADHSVTSVTEVSGGFGVRTYPNPVSGKLTVELEGGLFDGEVALVLFDGVGRKLQEVRTGVVVEDRNAFFLEMGQYPPGTYFLRIADLTGPRLLVPVLKE